MTMKASTGLRNYLLDGGSLRSALANGFLLIYSGTVPADADASIGAATLLRTISLNSTGTGINFASAASAGAISKAAEVWSGVGSSAGTPTFFRHVAPADDGLLSTTQYRLQGTVGTTGTDLILASAEFIADDPTTIDSYSVSLPTA